MTHSMKELLAERASEEFVGRADELSALLTMLDGGPRIVLLHGIPGVGKSTLLAKFAKRARALGAVVVSLDCREMEPTERGFLHELGIAIGRATAEPRLAAEAMASLGSQVVLALDNYEVFRLMDTWLREVFVPTLPNNVGVVLVGRDSPALGWLVSPGWQELVRTIALEALGEAEAIELLVRSGASRETARQINRFTRGHPLAVKLAGAVAIDKRGSDDVMTSPGFQRVVEELTRQYVADVGDPLTRRALDATSVVRRVTLSLLQAMLPDASAPDAFQRLRALPFVEIEHDGLRLHYLVQQAIATSLRAVDPNRYQEYRRLAWRQLSAESRGTGLPNLWRYTADLLYIIENPVVREAFFPTGGPQYSVAPARAEDGPAIQDITAMHEPATAASLIDAWWRRAPNAFHVVHDKEGEAAGFYLIFDPETIDATCMEEDPVALSWRNHLGDERSGVGGRGAGVGGQEQGAGDQRALFLRRWLSREDGERPSPVQAACWLDIKRIYMEMRPRLRRVYLTVQDLAAYAAVAQKLHFQPLPECAIELDGRVYSSAMLDFGPESVDGWLAGLAAAELGVGEEEFLDREAHEFVRHGERVKLTKLEFEVFQYLYERKGKAVTRASLVEGVWGWKQTGSNVVEAVVRSLRKKLGSRKSAIETIRGSGYRFRGL